MHHKRHLLAGRPTTVPIALVRMLNLREGSVLEWGVEIRDGWMMVLVRPAGVAYYMHDHVFAVFQMPALHL